MKLSEWINALQESLEHHGDLELLEMPDGWLQDVVPEELAHWLLMHRWVELTLCPDGLIVPGVLCSDPEDDEVHQVSTKLEDAVMIHADDPADRAEMIASLRRALAALGA